MNHPLLIEFVGLPGAGKTTIVNHIMDLECEESLAVTSFRSHTLIECGLAESSYSIVRSLAAVIVVGIALLKHPRMVLYLLRFTMLAKPLCWSRFKLIYGLVALIRRMDRIRTTSFIDHKAILLDQGVVQFLGSISLPSTRSNELPLEAVVPEAVLDRVDGLVWVDCDPEIAMQRVRGRTSGRCQFDHWSDDLFRQNQMVMLSVLQIATQCACDLGVPILTVATSVPPPVNAARVREWLKHLLASSPQRREGISSLRNKSIP